MPLMHCDAHQLPVYEALWKMLPPAAKFSSGYRRLRQGACTSVVEDRSRRSGRTHWTCFGICSSSPKAVGLSHKEVAYADTICVVTYPNNELASSANAGRGSTYLSPLKAEYEGSTCLYG